MFISVGRLWAGRSATKLPAPESRGRVRVEDAGTLNLPAAIGASDGELVRFTVRSMDAAEAHRHRATMLLLSNTGKRRR